MFSLRRRRLGVHQDTSSAGQITKPVFQGLEAFAAAALKVTDGFPKTIYVCLTVKETKNELVIYFLPPFK